MLYVDRADYLWSKHHGIFVSPRFHTFANSICCAEELCTLRSASMCNAVANCVHNIS